MDRVIFRRFDEITVKKGEPIPTKPRVYRGVTYVPTQRIVLHSRTGKYHPMYRSLPSS